MDEKVKKEILQRFEQLPKDIQNVILSSDFPSKIDVIRQKHQLTEEQGTDLSNEAMFVMIGLERPNDFIENIRKNIGLPTEKANMVAGEVNDTVFKQIRESLKNVHGPSEPESIANDPETILNRRTFVVPPAPPRPTPLTPHGFNMPQPTSLPSQKPAPSAPPNLPTGPASWQTFEQPRAPGAEAVPSPEATPAVPADKSGWASTMPSGPTTHPFKKAPPVAPASHSRYVPPPLDSVTAEIVEPSRQDEGIIEQKLRTPTTIPREEKMYVLDPYREPTE